MPLIDNAQGATQHARSTIEPGLYAITDPVLLPDEKLYSGVEAALRGGAVMVQYRDKLASPPLRRARARELLAVCRAYQKPLIINDDVALAVEIDADGAHLGLEDGNLVAARRSLGSGKLLGATCHGSLPLAHAAAAGGCDYLAFGRFYPSRTKADAPAAPLTILTDARALGLPVTAIGGMTTENASTVAHAGADLIAVIHGLFASDDIESRARLLTQIIHDGHTANA